jgi:hypothetical protein
MEKFFEIRAGCKKADSICKNLKEEEEILLFVMETITKISFTSIGDKEDFPMITLQLMHRSREI